MSNYRKQSHVVWKCDYHIVFCPKYRFRILTGVIKDLVRRYVKYQEEQDRKEENNSRSFNLVDRCRISRVAVEGYAFLFLPNPPSKKVVV